MSPGFSFLVGNFDLADPNTSCNGVLGQDECALYCLYQLDFTQITSTTANITVDWDTYDGCDCTVFNMYDASISGNVATGLANDGLTGKLVCLTPSTIQSPSGSLLLTYSNSTGSIFCQLPMYIHTGTNILCSQPPNTPIPGVGNYWWAFLVGFIGLIAGIASIYLVCMYCSMGRTPKASKGEVLAQPNTGVIRPFAPIASSIEPPTAQVVDILVAKVVDAKGDPV